MKVWRVLCLILLLCGGCKKKPLPDMDPLQRAVRSGNLQQIRSLVAHGADVNARDKCGLAPLHNAVESGHKRMVSLLISLGADVDAMSARGRTPFWMAVMRGQGAVAQALLAAGANPNARDRWGRTVLHCVGLVNFAEFLLAHGAHVDANDREGLTPLHAAAWENQVNMAMLLLTHGANPNGRDVNGQTPLDVAAHNGYKELFDLLVDRGADAHVKDEQGLTPLDHIRMPPAPQVVRVHADDESQYATIIANPNVVRQFLRGMEIPFDRVWIPDKPGIEVLDLKTAIQRGSWNSPGVLLQIDDLLHRLPGYNQEYAGFIREGRKYVFCNLGSGEPNRNSKNPRFSWGSQYRIIVDFATGAAVQIGP